MSKANKKSKRKNNFDYDKYNEFDIVNEKPVKKEIKPESNLDVVNDEEIFKSSVIYKQFMENDTKLKHVILATEKLIKMMHDLETNVNTINAKLNSLENNLECKSFGLEAEDALKQWMMEEKNKDSFDYPMSKSEIQKAFNNYNKRAGK